MTVFVCVVCVCVCVGEPVQCTAWLGQCILYILIMMFEKVLIMLVLLIPEWKKVRKAQFQKIEAELYWSDSGEIYKSSAQTKVYTFLPHMGWYRCLWPLLSRVCVCILQLALLNPIENPNLELAIVMLIVPFFVNVSLPGEPASPAHEFSKDAAKKSIVERSNICAIDGVCHYQKPSV